jgi:hypothetical protein
MEEILMAPIQWDNLDDNGLALVSEGAALTSDVVTRLDR